MLFCFFGSRSEHQFLVRKTCLPGWIYLCRRSASNILGRHGFFRNRRNHGTAEPGHNIALSRAAAFLTLLRSSIVSRLLHAFHTQTRALFVWHCPSRFAGVPFAHTNTLDSHPRLPTIRGCFLFGTFWAVGGCSLSTCYYYGQRCQTRSNLAFEVSWGS